MKRLREGKDADDNSIPTIHDLYERYIKDKPLAKTTLTAYKYYIPRTNSLQFLTARVLGMFSLEGNFRSFLYFPGM